MSVWKSWSTIICWLTCFFDGLFTWAWVCHTFSLCSLDTTRTCFWSCASLATNVWLIVRPITLTFCLSSTHYFITIHIHLGLLQLIVAHFSQYGHTIDDLSIHLLWCPCGSEHIATHNILQYTITTICFGEWNTCTKRGFPIFSLLDLMISQYSYH